MSQINTLTQEQELLITQIKQKWLDLQTISIDVDREAAKSAVSELYRVIDKEQPEFIFVKSPASACLTLALLEEDGNRDALGDALGDTLRNVLWDSPGNSLRDALWDALWDALGGSLWDLLEDLLRNPLRNSLRNSLDDLLRDSLEALLESTNEALLGGSLRNSMGDLLGNSLSPQWMQSSSALFEMGKAIGVQFDDEKYEIFQRWCQYVDWIFPFEGICIVCDRPSTVRWDSEGRIHADGNPAVRFDDGFEVWARHGVRLVRGMVFA